MFGDKRTRTSKFKRLGESRTRRAIHYIELIGNLSNKNYYEYDKVQVKAITRALRGAIKNIEDVFEEEAGKIRRFKL